MANLEFPRLLSRTRRVRLTRYAGDCGSASIGRCKASRPAASWSSQTLCRTMGWSAGSAERVGERYPDRGKEESFDPNGLTGWSSHAQPSEDPDRDVAGRSQAGDQDRTHEVVLRAAAQMPSKGGPSFYDFLPYHHGPYSFCLSGEANTLAQRA